jgi:hypothetical protein
MLPPNINIIRKSFMKKRIRFLKLFLDLWFFKKGKKWYGYVRNAILVILISKKNVYIAVSLS